MYLGRHFISLIMRVRTGQAIVIFILVRYVPVCDVLLRLTKVYVVLSVTERINCERAALQERVHSIIIYTYAIVYGKQCSCYRVLQ